MPNGGESYEILEHTADVGLRAVGKSLEDLFRNAAWGMLEIMGAAAEEGAEAKELAIEATDQESLLVSFLDELIYLVDSRNARVADLDVGFEGATWLVATVEWVRSREPLEGTELKAATLHQLSVEETPEGYEATVYFDV